MKKYANIIVILFVLLMISGCDQKTAPTFTQKVEAPSSYPRDKEQPKPIKEELNPPKAQINSIYLPDHERQKDIKEARNRDNFNYDQFAHVDWKDPSTFGASGNYFAHLSKHFSLDQHNYYYNYYRTVIEADHLQPDDYRILSIKGDGSCWMRSSMISLLALIFYNEKYYLSMVNNIEMVAEKYADVPGFSLRFRPQELTDLITTLYNLSPKERLNALNKDVVDRFLDYNFRAFLHAYYTHREKKELATGFIKRPYPDKDFIQYLTDKSWGYTLSTFDSLIFSFLGRGILDKNLVLPMAGNNHAEIMIRKDLLKVFGL